jgi:lipoyl-dependent peroxiredoxin
MPRIVREAEIDWVGTTARGSGVVRAASTGSFELSATIASRIDVVEGKTSPEELLAAAHATCFVTSLGSELARLGAAPERMHVRCTITMDEVEGGHHRIVHSALAARALAPGADEASLAKAAQEADAGCPLSALVRASATVSVAAVLEGGDS